MQVDSRHRLHKVHIWSRVRIGVEPPLAQFWGQYYLTKHRFKNWNIFNYVRPSSDFVLKIKTGGLDRLLACSDDILCFFGTELTDFFVTFSWCLL